MRRVLSAIIAAVLALLLAGCSIQLGPTNPYTTNWAAKAGRDLSCQGGEVQHGKPSVYNIDQDDSNDEVFVVMHCVTNDTQKSKYGQLEVFDRGADPYRPPRKVIVYWRERVEFLESPSFRDNQVTIEGVRDRTRVTCTASLNEKHQIMLGDSPDRSASSACS